MRTEVVKAQDRSTGKTYEREVQFPESYDEILDACGGDQVMAVKIFNRGWRLYHQADMKLGGKAKLREVAKKLAQLPPEKVQELLERLEAIG